MSQHDYSIANQTFPNTRSDINSALSAIATLNSGSSAPTTTFANMLWSDTNDYVLKQRDESDSSWKIIRSLDTDMVISKTAAYTIQVRDFGKMILADASGGAFTITLPSASSASEGYFVNVVKVDASNDVTVEGDGSETINGLSDMDITEQYGSILYVCDGSNWTVQSSTQPLPDSVVLGVSTTGNYVEQGGTSGNGLSGSVNSEGGTFTVTSNATDANTGDTIVYRDSNGDFSARNIDSQTTLKAWVVFDATGTLSISDSYNVTSVTDNGTGDYTVNFTNNLANTDYGVLGCVNANNESNYLREQHVIVKDNAGKTVSGCNILVGYGDVNSNNWNGRDMEEVYVAFFATN